MFLAFDGLPKRMVDIIEFAERNRAGGVVGCGGAEQAFGVGEQMVLTGYWRRHCYGDIR